MITVSMNKDFCLKSFIPISVVYVYLDVFFLFFLTMLLFTYYQLLSLFSMFISVVPQ